MKHHNFSNLIQIIPHIVKSHQSPHALNFTQNGQWVNISTEEFADKIRKLALGLNNIGLGRGNSFGNTSYPNPIWIMMDFAAIAVGAITVPIFPNISTQNFKFEVNDADVDFIFCDSEEGLQLIRDSKRKFKKIIIHGFDSDHDNTINFDDLLRIGEEEQKNNADLYEDLSSRVKGEDLATIIYTSGSTGVPKGVELTHNNLISQIKGTGDRFVLDPKKDIAFSFLPLAHIFERMVTLYYISYGIPIYFADDVQNVGKLVKQIKPTLMTVVPRMLEKVYNKMKSNVDESGFVKRIIGQLAFNYALKPRSKLCFFGKVFDRLVYVKLRAALGGRFKMMICGSAPLAIELEYFFKNIGIDLYAGYGATESSPVISVNYPGFSKFGTVGKPYPEVEAKTESDGELLARGPNIMRGYHNDFKKTSCAINKDGWLVTGDLAEIDNDGYITIVGRKKELFKTAYGKYVSPVPIEQKLVSKGEFLAAAMVVAESRKFVSCLLFPDFETLDNYKKKMKMGDLSDKDFLSSEFIISKINKLIANTNKNLNHWEQIRKYHLALDPISIQNGELTPSMKISRGKVEEKYQIQIEGFYK